MGLDRIRNEQTDLLIESLLQLRTLDEGYQLLEDLCTIREVQDLAQRIAVAAMLKQGVTYHDIAAITGASDRSANYFAELETAGKCVEWVKDHLALDEVGIYMKKHDVTQGDDMERKYTSLYTYLQDVIKTVPAGSNGVVFTPWFHGNRCPFEDPNARAMFFNMSLDNGKSDLIRAVVEGVCFHMRWFIEAQEKKVKCSDPVRFVGGGALGATTCQILADCLGRRVETVASSQNVGSVGAAAVVAAGLGLVSDVSETEKLVSVEKVYEPDPSVKAVYDKNYAVYKQLYSANKKNFAMLNS